MISSVVWNEEEIVKNIPKVITSPNMSLKILKDCLKKWIRVKIEEFILFVGFLKKLGTFQKHNSRSSQLKRHNQHFMINFEYYADTFPFFKGFFCTCESLWWLSKVEEYNYCCVNLKWQNSLIYLFSFFINMQVKKLLKFSFEICRKTTFLTVVRYFPNKSLCMIWFCVWQSGSIWTGEIRDSNSCLREYSSIYVLVEDLSLSVSHCPYTKRRKIWQ